MSSIDKKEYQEAWNDDKEKFWKMTYDLADIVSHRFRFNKEVKEEYRAFAIESAFRAARKYKPEKALAFSYFYKCLLMGYMYRMRLEKTRKHGMLEQQLNEDVAAEETMNDTYIMIGNKIMTKEEVKRITSEYKVKEHQRKKDIKRGKKNDS